MRQCSYTYRLSLAADRRRYSRRTATSAAISAMVSLILSTSVPVCHRGAGVTVCTQRLTTMLEILIRAPGIPTGEFT